MRKIHLVLSLAAGLWLAVSGLAGSLLVFGDALDQTLHRELFAVRGAARAGIDRVLDAAETATNGRATRIRVAGSNTPVHEVWIDCDDCRRVWVDPSTTKVNGIRSAHGTTRTFLHEFHRRMLFRGAGDVAALVGGVALVGISLSGLWLGWRGGWRLRRLTFYELHRAIGLYVSPFLLIAGGTGIYFIQAGLKAAPAKPPVARARDVDRALLAAMAAVPRAEPTWITLGEATTVRLRRDGEKHPNGTTFVKVAAGEVKLVTDKTNRVYPLHIGMTGGLVHRIVLVFAGMTPAFFLVTGLVLWLRRMSRRSVLRRCPTRASSIGPSC